MGNFVSSNLQGPTNIWFDVNGDMLVADYNGSSVKRFDQTGNFINNYLTGLSQCEGVAMFPNGNILIGNGGTQSVKMFDSNGMFLQDLIAPGALNLLNPNAVVLRPVTNVSLSENMNIHTLAIHPSIGTEFYISKEYSGKIKTITFYNSLGKVINTKYQQNGSLVLNAKNLTNGLYIARIELENGEEVIQKLLIQN
jgi:hypothetical protein